MAIEMKDGVISNVTKNGDDEKYRYKVTILYNDSLNTIEALTNKELKNGQSGRFLTTEKAMGRKKITLLDRFEQSESDKEPIVLIDPAEELSEVDTTVDAEVETKENIEEETSVETAAEENQIIADDFLNADDIIEEVPVSVEIEKKSSKPKKKKTSCEGLLSIFDMEEYVTVAEDIGYSKETEELATLAADLSKGLADSNKVLMAAVTRDSKESKVLDVVEKAREEIKKIMEG